MNKLIAEYNVKEMIIVAVNDKYVMGGSFYVDLPVAGNWDDYVVNYIDSNYRTIENPASRGICIHSMEDYLTRVEAAQKTGQYIGDKLF